ncbi:phosphorybosylanthranilate isomerase [bacterium (Candidatus Blackallbacteria) CG17_big_fil_post_rev_8_21_14_2_50_48_46]|uniref:Phosphorybosylanthranilate isomerase n=1 Tax=bacterium (Candidatus Blackallbacteria) CG17_big_fil_post_rev_8_21_14_2_50_48_46 TaxID=2014261 RepID=A0A2M7G516_9BACT|nr:MAG: phosphorybosylanthranilate isomerase [bacterium (Candidatus Blackallbacteria) CG18_big_fil_WC_8_21_14_2_50_49_26]PIW17037.1 MAG: phosphorybosylanthranilate isomerase [bacterium (Candidatus Blackallbacteria) CG17_big_fil_post_rev_8_21_14_2_50_48_46]PIW48154.1 MAG: phosphorybosylanthranilate isomerase [bacterium (Candidatus Blackallbacteria) CG13_big_fil_rev_8_21_14_2_50_49_14]
MTGILSLFSRPKPVIACIHLQPLPGAPAYRGDMKAVYETALQEVEIFKQQGVDGLIVENFRDAPFYPEQLPAETVAALAAVSREIVKASGLPVGVNALRNDAPAAVAIATAAEAHFIRVNVHLGAVIADQGLIQGNAHLSLRLRAQLHSRVMIVADVGVKHAAPLAPRGLAAEAHELAERGKVDGLIVSGAFTGAETALSDLAVVKQNAALPVWVGSGATPENLTALYPHCDGLIVGSTFKQAGHAENPVDPARVSQFMQQMQSLRTEFS